MDYTKQPGQKAFERRMGDNGEPLVSIITAFYNLKPDFEQTFQCVMNQTFPWFEWIIVDDGSTQPEALSLLEELPERDARIRVVHQPNLRQAAARNKGLSLARAEVVIPLDSDDLIAPTYLERTYWALYFNPEADWCYTDSVGFGAKEYEWVQPFFSQRMKKENTLVCTAAIRTSALRAVGGYTVQEQCYDEDWELWLKLLAQGSWPVHLPECRSFWYRRSSDGMQQQVSRNKTLHKQSMEWIRSAAKHVPDGITGKSYPAPVATGKYSKPEVLNWNRRIQATKTKKHLLLLLPWTEMGGADLFNLDVVRQIDPNEYSVTVVTTQMADNVWSERFEEYTPDVLHLPGFLDEENVPAFLSYLIASREVDIVLLSNSYLGYELAPWLRRQFPKLVLVDYVHMEEWYWRNGGYARTSGMAGCAVDLTLTCNGATRRVLTEHFHRRAESVELLYIGVDHRHYDPAKIEDGQAHTALNIAAKRPIILFPCRIHPQKRPFLMLEIAGRVRKVWPEAAFVVVGDGQQLKELQIKTKEAGLTNTVYFAGRQDDMRPFYRDACLTLICSLKEGLALTAYESLSMGCPVITSDVGGQAELVDESVGAVVPLMQSEEEELDKRSFPEEEVCAYVDAILRLGREQNPQERSCRCRERIVNGFSSEKMIQRLQEIFQELLENPEIQSKRQRTACALNECGEVCDELFSLYREIDGYEYMYQNRYGAGVKSELLRLANSKWGRRMVKLMFKLKLNRLFR